MNRFCLSSVLPRYVIVCMRLCLFFNSLSRFHRTASTFSRSKSVCVWQRTKMMRVERAQCKHTAQHQNCDRICCIVCAVFHVRLIKFVPLLSFWRHICICSRCTPFYYEPNTHRSSLSKTIRCCFFISLSFSLFSSHIHMTWMSIFINLNTIRAQNKRQIFILFG